MIKDWQSRNYEGIESPLGYVIRRGRWTDRPVWKRYTTWWVEISVVAGFNIDHPFLWYLLLWMPDPNRVSHNNCLFISGSVVGISATANIPPKEVSILGAVSGMRIDLSGVSGIAITEGLALGFGMAYSTSSVLEVDGIAYSNQAFEQLRFAYANEQYTFFYGSELTDFCY